MEDNVFQALYNASMLQIIVFALFFGVALLALGERTRPLAALAEADAVAAATDKILANEEKIVAEITGKGTYTRPWVETKLAALGCEYDEI